MDQVKNYCKYNCNVKIENAVDFYRVLGGDSFDFSNAEIDYSKENDSNQLNNENKKEEKKKEVPKIVVGGKKKQKKYN